MNKVPAHSVDFAALKTLRLVFEAGSFSVAAEKLDVGQPTVSYAIERLRRVFQDPLFVRQGGGIAATDRCAEIVGSVSGMLDEFDTLCAPSVFMPAETTATVSISCNFYERLTILPALIRTVRKQAPKMKLEIVQSSTLGAAQLKTGQSEILISPMKIDSSDIYSRVLFRDHYVCVMDSNNPLAQTELDLANYINAPHAVVTYGGSWRSFYLQELEKRGESLNQVVGIPSPGNLKELLTGTDLISTLPNRIADSYGADIHTTESPCPAPFEVYLYWSLRTHRSPMYQWLRQQIVDITSKQA